ncbi:MAG: hypothetical protein ACREFC_05305 [Stellaceae bacterium]
MKRSAFFLLAGLACTLGGCGGGVTDTVGDLTDSIFGRTDKVPIA